MNEHVLTEYPVPVFILKRTSLAIVHEKRSEQGCITKSQQMAIGFTNQASS